MYAARDAKREVASDFRRQSRTKAGGASAASSSDPVAGSAFRVMFVILAIGGVIGLLANGLLAPAMHLGSLTRIFFWAFIIAFFTSPAFRKMTEKSGAAYLVIIVVGLLGLFMGSLVVSDVTPLGAGHLTSEMKVFNEKAIATSSATGSRAGKVRAMDCAA